MIRLIAAIDSLRGIANDKGIPWDLPSDSAYYREKVSNGSKILMGYGTYKNHKTTIQPNTIEYVYCKPRNGSQTHVEALRSGFSPVDDIDTFFKENSPVWVLGGSQLFNATIHLADELYITQVCGDFNCTKFFPSFENNFMLVKKSKIKKENGIEFQYQLWKPKRLTSPNNTE